MKPKGFARRSRNYAMKARVHVIEHPLANDASDTERSVQAFVAAGCSTLVSLGGDGTNRAIARTCPDIDLVPLSTGTNNVFPVLAEPTIAGMVAGLNACGKLSSAPELKTRVKLLHVRSGERRDVGLIDAVLLRNDNVGNLLPFDSDRISQVFLTRAEPNSIGMSPIGGLIRPVYAEDDYGMLITTGGAGPGVLAPVSPGLFREVNVADTTDVNFEVAVPFRGPGVLALDGDRDIWLSEGDTATVTLRRDGPFVIDIEATMRWAVAQGMMAPSNLTRTQL
jgi:hypothetical protein